MTDQTGRPEQYADSAQRYRLEQRIATGGMGVVWRATDTRLNRPVAVKVLKHEFADDPQFRTRFDTEARNAAALQHPGIAGVFDYSSDPDGADAPYLVMELVEGQPLSTLLAQARDSGRTLDPEVVRDLVTQTADALAVAHRAGIVHRDVKPANLLITPDRRVKVTDFGIARAADDAQITRTGAVMGTPQYLSPEQARGNPAVPASDVYALGVVAFECLVGRRPFEAETPVATALAHLQQPVPDLPEDLPADLRAIVTRSLAKEPSERYADGAVLAAALRGEDVAPPVVAPAPEDDATAVLPSTPAQPSIPVVAPAPAAPTPRLDRAEAYRGEPAPEERKSRAWIAAVLLVLVLVAAALAAVALLTGDDEDDPAADDRPSRTASRTSEATTEETSSEPTSTAPTTTAPEMVTIDESDYVGRPVSEVERELQLLGLAPRLIEDANPGDQDEDDVLSVNPTGELEVGSAVDVHYWGAPPATTPTTETTAPTDSTTTETGTTESTEGGEG
ncbi:serine/threonine protein kinase [Nocardioides silvaticus]|uniref:non-specific serine/threonine protein kinase n=1 Tax=Nocardioides silvaticus TaxID=2201891 RepID=A0A316TFM4_9ACTN|nr:serine/threonine-protein kinase [Nocardioides silvaticus]PWN02588.1 serine/threonine protein kinase [Nocardioides silvaticus]